VYLLTERFCFLTELKRILLLVIFHPSINFFPLHLRVKPEIAVTR